MSLPIISADERMRERHSAKVALVGFPGVGKTTQLKTLPADSTLFVDLEAGDLSVRDWPGDTVRPRTWQEFRDLVVFLAGPMPTATAEQAFSQAHFEHVCTRYGDPAQLAKYDTYFVDSLTVLSRLCFGWCKAQPQAFSEKNGKPDSRGAYGLLGQEMITALTHLQHVRDKHVIYVAILEAAGQTRTARIPGNCPTAARPAGLTSRNSEALASLINWRRLGCRIDSDIGIRIRWRHEAQECGPRQRNRSAKRDRLAAGKRLLCPAIRPDTGPYR